MKMLKKSYLVNSTVLFVFTCFLLSSCSPSREEKALVIYCESKVPQMTKAGSGYYDYEPQDCCYENNIYLSFLNVYTDRDLVELHIGSLNDDDEQLKKTFKAQGEKILLCMAFSNKRLLTMLKQIQEIGYSLSICIMLDETCVFDKEQISCWNLNNIENE